MTEPLFCPDRSPACQAARVLHTDETNRFKVTAAKPTAPAYAGVYTLPDAARVLRLRASKLRAWIKSEEDTKAGAFLSQGAGRERHFDFHTLIELYAVAFLRERGVSMSAIRHARDELARRFSTPHPFALRGLLLSGRDILKELGDGALLELGKSGQTAFEEVLAPFCEKLEFDQSTGLASAFYPEGRQSAVVVDPRRAFGKPVIRGTGTPTETLAALIRSGDSPQQVAEDFRLRPDQVEDAWRFENRAA